MKTRIGFVSNSSSSSFVVAWPKKPKTVEQMNEMLFGDLKQYANPYAWEGVPSHFHVDTVSEWLLQYLKWTKKDVRKSLVDNLKNDVYFIIRELAEKRGNSFTFVRDGTKLVSCLSLYRKQAVEVLTLLENHYPRVKWQARFEVAVKRRAKWYKLREIENKKEGILIKKLRKKHNCSLLPWVDTAKMTQEEKDAHKQLEKENYALYDTLVLKDQEYITHRKKIRKIWQQEREDVKTTETINLAANRLAVIFEEENAGCAFSVIEISDDWDLGSSMEHGDLFDKLPHKRFNHH